MTELTPMAALLATLPQQGAVRWIGVRPARDEAMIEVDSAQLLAGKGVVGDRFKGRAGAARQVTLIQYEHLQVIASCLNRVELEPSIVRRNIAVSGLNLLALKDKRFVIGDAVLEYSGLAHPCSKMERLLGPGGYNAMRGHGGITARVCASGVIRLGDAVSYERPDGE